MIQMILINENNPIFQIRFQVHNFNPLYLAHMNLTENAKLISSALSFPICVSCLKPIRTQFVVKFNYVYIFILGITLLQREGHPIVRSLILISLLVWSSGGWLSPIFPKYKLKSIPYKTFASTDSRPMLLEKYD